MSRAVEAVRRVDRRFEESVGRFLEVAVPVSGMGRAAVLSGVLVWLPLYTVIVIPGLNVAEDVLWAGAEAGEAFEAAFVGAGGLAAARSEAGLPVLCGFALGGAGLVPGWAAAVRRGQWIAGSATALLATPMVHLLCWAYVFTPGVGWFEGLAGCLLLGMVLSLPVWGVLWWAVARQRGGFWDGLYLAANVGAAALSCGMAELWLARMVRVLDGILAGT